LGPINKLTFSNDGKYLASASEDNTIIIWDLYHGKQLNTFKSNHNDNIWSLDFNKSGSLLVSGSNDCTINIFDLNNSKLLSTYYTKQTPVFNAKFIDNNYILASGPFII
jgi:transcription initiation factor TFIID subunit 5